MPVDSYLDPIICLRKAGTINDPYLPVAESFMIKNNKVILSQIPDRFSKVKVTGGGISNWTEITKGIPQQNEYIIDYIFGTITFHSSRENTSPTFEYMGTGAVYFPYSRIWTREGDIDTIQTLEDSISNALLIANSASEFRHRLDFNITTRYYYRNIVDYNSQVFFCIDENPDGIVGVLPTDTNSWRLLAGLSAHPTDTNNPHAVTKAQVGLANVLDAEQIPKSIFTMKGQIIYASDAIGYPPAVLDKGLAGTILKMGEMVPQWGNLTADEVGAFSKEMLVALPTASETDRGNIKILQGGTGVADKIYICIKDATDAYVWKELSFV